MTYKILSPSGECILYVILPESHVVTGIASVANALYII